MNPFRNNYHVLKSTIVSAALLIGSGPASEYIAENYSQKTALVTLELMAAAAAICAIPVACFWTHMINPDLRIPFFQKEPSPQ